MPCKKTQLLLVPSLVIVWLFVFSDNTLGREEEGGPSLADLDPPPADSRLYRSKEETSQGMKRSLSPKSQVQQHSRKNQLSLSHASSGVLPITFVKLSFSKLSPVPDPHHVSCFDINKALWQQLPVRSMHRLEEHPSSSALLADPDRLKSFVEEGQLCLRRFADVGTFPVNVEKRLLEMHRLRTTDALRRLFDCPSLAVEAITPRFQSVVGTAAVTEGERSFTSSIDGDGSTVFASLNWKEWLRTSVPPYPIEEAVSLITEEGGAPAVLPSILADRTTTFRRIPKHGSWVFGDHLVATCEPRTFFSDKKFPFFFYPHHTCVVVLWSIGSPDRNTLAKLKSVSRKGRNAIFREREGTFVYGGPLEQRLGTFPSSTQLFHNETGSLQRLVRVRGTTVLNAAFNVGNVGHVIHDALWALQVALAAPETFPAEFFGSQAQSDRWFNSTSSQYQLLFGQDFGPITSEYYGLTSSLLALGEARQEGRPTHSFRFPEGFVEGTTCLQFDRLLLPGQDRHIDGGGAGLRQVTAERIRRHVFQSLAIVNPTKAAKAGRRPRIFIYGRSDVHRRSIDNMQSLHQLALDLSKDLQLVPPVLIDTFSRPVAEQIALMAEADVMMSVQGSHQQNSLFMPEDAVIVEIAPCRAHRVSFLQRYNPYLSSHAYWYAPLCDGVLVNYGDPDPVSQNITVCPAMIQWIHDKVRGMIVRQMESRGLSIPLGENNGNS